MILIYIKYVLTKLFQKFKNISALFPFLLLSVTMAAQSDKTVRGLIKDSTNKVLSNATVSLFVLNVHRDTLKTISNEKGEFIFNNVNGSDFKIQVTSVSYGDFIKIYHYADSVNDISIPVIHLSSLAKVLEEVIVTVDRTVTIKEDTIEFKADSFKLKPDADVEALLKKIPGVQVDASGNITAYGKSINKIRVNGKDFFSGDVKTATKELPANIVDLVQVIDDYGDQAAFSGVKDGDPDKIINLQIKKDKNKGHFGRGQAGYGTDQRYTVNGSANHFNNDQQISLQLNFNNTNTSTFSLPRPPGSSGSLRSGGMPDNGTMNSVSTIINNGDGGFLQNGQVSNDGISRTNSIGLNYRDDWGKKLSIYGSYTFTDKQTVTLSNTEQTNLFTTGSVVNYQNSNKTENSSNHRLFFNAEWKIDSFNLVKISPTISYSKTNSTTVSDFLFNRNSNEKLNDGTSTYINGSVQPNISGTILYNHRFRRPGRLFSANFTAGYNSTDQTDDQVNNSIFYPQNSSAGVVNEQHQFVTQYNTNPTRSIRLSYIEPLTKKKSFELNYTNSYSFTDNDKQTYLIDNGTATWLDSLSNIYGNTFTYNRLGINYRYNDKKYNYSIGVAAQTSDMKGESFITKSNFKQTTFNWFPLARFTYNFSRTRTLSVNYLGSISTPSYSQLQPVYDYSNPQYPIIGNPDLKPEFKNIFSARYNNFDFISGNVLFTNISYTFSKDKAVINSIDKFSNGNGGSAGAIQETQYLNANGYYTASGFYAFSKPFQKRKYTLSLNGNFNYSNNISFINSQKNTGKNFVGTQGLNFDVKLNDWLEMGAGGNFTYNHTKNSLTPQSNTEVRTYTISSNGKIYFPAKIVLSYDLNKTFNSGYGVSANPFIINGYLERQFSKNNQLSIRLQTYDLLNQNTSISRTVNANSITDTRTNKLGQYFMLSFNFRLQKFKGQQPKMQFPPGPPPERLPPFIKSS
ncbi:MAG TPA: TonB-dependent receptor [Chitinophagaceae bacterium]|nr:TonB-dependent receptor [Chitinophagaceae bacterium]